MKAFLVNASATFGFILGIGSSSPTPVLWITPPCSRRHPNLAETTINIWGTAEWSLMTVTCICLFIGAMGKSAQVPLHVWLPDLDGRSDPISALIHAATMVTAGIFMVSRMSPLFELCPPRPFPWFW